MSVLVARFSKNSAGNRQFCLYDDVIKMASWYNRPRSIYQYSSMAPRLSGKNCKFFKVLLSLNSQRRLRYKENNTKYRSLTWKPRSHVRILIYRTWPILKKLYSPQNFVPTFLSTVVWSLESQSPGKRTDRASIQSNQKWRRMKWVEEFCIRSRTAAPKLSSDSLTCYEAKGNLR